MRGTGTHRHNRRYYGVQAPRGAPMFYGWSHDESRMQMMDLPSYLDSFRLGYERAVEDLQGQLAGVTQSYLPSGYSAPTWPGQPQTGWGDPSRHGQHRHHDHDCDCECHDHHGHHDHHDRHGHGHEHGRHGHRHDHDCGCGKYDDCHCDCCIVDADYVVYARCLERRLVPIQIDNDTRKVREDVTLEVSDVRTSGGRVLPWRVRVNPQSPITLAPCSTTEIDLLVEIECGDAKQEPEPAPGRKTAAQKAADAKDAEAAAAGAADAAQDPYRGHEPVDVDGCEVGYVTIRVGGCIVRPIVVAIAVLPRDCDAYHASCSCSCC